MGLEKALNFYECKLIGSDFKFQYGHVSIHDGWHVRHKALDGAELTGRSEKLVPRQYNE